MKAKTRQIRVGNVPVGGDAPCSVQSMCNTDTRDAGATLDQINALAAAGCEIVRCAVPDMAAAEALGAIKRQSPIPVIADIHFDYKLALKVLEGGIDGLRLNPGNIGERWKVEEVVAAARERLVPIRIGVNAGSLEKELLQKYGHPTAEAMVESALGHVRILEELGYDQIKISLKASDVPKTVAAYRLLAQRIDYPLHIGITEAGTMFSGTIKSAVGLGILLADGIGDTLRVSLTGDPVDEVRVGFEILKALNLRQKGINLVSCPTCGRCQINLIGVAEEVEKRLAGIDAHLTVAVMGCVVNGPGEAREADVGIAGGRGEGLLFRNGEIVRKVPEADMADALIAEVEKILAEKH
ncbi:flavodoxin-dependent (E)-4-hydroxy-3-methylbut-2-enyl-diphosphate synthase [Geobacter sulfurreducens]|jgi:(E)-4-hydroxy-3-methylbut-2-enyl-diphosphate synthase|uniref:4-hydroxy-3-methylbut-2-en-1-yl diphosphate synthase (flavodoxin) n=1 Tax=Geobacter sulfurreducens (strain ATCC 51573 / DSM 12127 / PCA) TaxID=243231 RepID=ISPG_GEOSL|nr:flavodoxin-dependent (E)-4-hydroxy-3-methylbut-2-enyl-diphosphate synthase [Geobacter sulfurreducens]Q74D60.1 RecName: Full=4-hydroxy-3-methylbut-2-en-1-yl diphosphate synthase (flavodoxin); AltName: Full=1-hydroxy-2-methyl-2-(E)-butenyl 4-diphosphate synthase [Geobacter sulfurreducens PCA]AAR34833.1 4-hydroxy-3-methylbut-2-en-1-yl diphosphate synthase [Geobacter sulfurreducens PCA]ADI84298.2 4-hydroxy-3-methylbut-2-en-1-yl diphosphate synthase [Geobacter sulfurreducens KN400]AJY71661.1 4-hy